MQSFDLILLAFKGLAIASLPLAVVWVGRAPREHGDRLRRLAWVTAFLTFDLVVFGGFTRLTDSGLGCPDWPGCYAKANPFMATDAIRAAEEAMPSGPVTMSKAWIEMIHRYLAMAVGVLIVSMVVISVRRKRHADPERSFPAITFGLLALVLVQGAFGAWTVTQKLQPIFVTTHLLLGLSLLALLLWHALRFEGTTLDPMMTRAAGRLRGFALFASVVLIVQIALGGWVSANYAVLACTDFPTCHGVWLPSMDFDNGFHPWRDLGRTADGKYLSLEALTAIHWAHRAFAGVAFVVLGLLAVSASRLGALRSAAAALGLLLAMQALTGIANVIFAWPLGAAVLHNAGAAGLVACLVVINYRLRASAGSQPSNDALRPDAFHRDDAGPLGRPLTQPPHRPTGPSRKSRALHVPSQ